jgi:hypothetical protein
MNLLSITEREALLKALSDAPDEILIDAVRQRKDWMKTIKQSFDEVRSFVGMKVVEAAKPPSQPAITKTVEVSNDPRPNINPGPSSITKIGTKTTDELLAVLKAGKQPNHDKYGEHLKLLWSRGVLNYDGKGYFI